MHLEVASCSMSISGLEERRKASLPVSSPFVEMKNADVDASKQVNGSAGTCILPKISHTFHAYNQYPALRATCVLCQSLGLILDASRMMARNSITCDRAILSSATCDFSHRVQNMLCVSEVSSDLSHVTVDHKMAVASFHCFPLALKGGPMI